MLFPSGSKLIFLLFLVSNLKAQNKYWVYSGEKDQKSTLLESKAENCSQWLNACTFYLSGDQVRQLEMEGYQIAPVLSFIPTCHAGENGKETGFALEQIEAQYFIEKGLTGAGVKIGLIDGGFLDADKEKNLQHFFANNLIGGYRDFVTPNLPPYGGSKGLDDDHGTDVWNFTGGKDRQKNIQFGLATQSTYYLARTDHGGFERRIEEDFFIEALEWMDSLGIKLINASLGYNLGFTDPSENYQPHQMDGKTSAIARAVEIAATQKGMLIVVAAGNEGGVEGWQILSTPADAEHALTVGSSKYTVWDKMNFSSIGPEFLPYVKPDIAVYSTGGTSFSAPIITGMAACMWEMAPELSNMEIIGLFKKAGHFYPFPNNYLGYGVPTCSGILQLMEGNTLPAPQEIHTDKGYIKIKNTHPKKYLITYHKDNQNHVLGRVVYRSLNKKIKVKRLNDAHQTSLLMGNEVIEIFWSDDHKNMKD